VIRAKLVTRAIPVIRAPVIHAIGNRVLAVFSSLATSCVLLSLLGLLTWLGTLEQTQSGLYEVQRKYFESFVLVHHVGSVPIPLPGANLVMSLLLVNLVVGGLVRLRKGWSTAGILVAHLGIVMLILSAFVKHRFSEDGHVTLYEGEKRDHFESWFRWELVIAEDAADLGNGRVREHVVPDERIVEARDHSVRVTAPDLPFAIEIERSWQNCRPEWTAPPHAREAAASIVQLVERPPEAQAEGNIAGATLSIVEDANGTRRTALVWGAESRPFTFVAAGRRWAVTLRKENYPLPFTLGLQKFTKEDHPRSDMPRSFASDVEIREASTTRDVRISMNEPLRDSGLVVYQASWGPSNAMPGQRLFSTFAVVRNPADRGPFCACLVIAAGLLFHFSRKLLRFVRRKGLPA
jgi:hypothetical protein